MKRLWLITFRSVTYAQRGERALKKNAIACQLQRTPKHLSERGCGYCLRLEGMDIPSAIEILRKEQIAYGKLYEVGDDGKMEEQM